MQSDIDLARNWRRAFFALFIAIAAGWLAYTATGGPGLAFYVISAFVIALLGVDLVIRARVDRADRASGGSA